ncbi:MAG TPA: ParB N-terminal domain-containing protein, partial [Terriglobales bacterium]|nr:ParB N-terminal domain-containing protein [Terriglobales bacterium]
LDAKNVAELVRLLEAGKVLPPIRITEGREVVFGLHRVAAALKLKHKRIRVDIVEYESRDEREEDEITENLKRLVLTKEDERGALARLVELRAKRLKANSVRAPHRADNPQSAENLRGATKKKTKPPSTKRRAIREVAAETGKSEDTVERAVNAQTEQQQEAETPPALPPPPCLDWFDVEPVGDVDAAARRVQALIDDVDSKLRAISRVLSGARETGLPNALAQQLEAEYDRFAHAVRAARPKAACASCKGRARAECMSCSGTGWATKAAADGDLPKELRARGAEAQVRNGRGGFRPLIGGEPPKVQAPERRIRIVDEADQETSAWEPPPDEEEPIF